MTWMQFNLSELSLREIANIYGRPVSRSACRAEAKSSGARQRLVSIRRAMGVQKRERESEGAAEEANGATPGAADGEQKKKKVRAVRILACPLAGG